MDNNQVNSLKSFEKGQSKDKQFQAHKKRKRIRNVELVTKWKNPVEVLERGTI